MTNVWFYTLTSVFIVSLISLVGIITLIIKIKKLENILLFFISFAAGALLGDVFIHLLPEGLENQSFNTIFYLLILAGILLFFIIEKVICWRHCHIPTSKQHPHVLGWMNLIGDGVHNFMDGMIIAASFMVSNSVGLATTLAVIFHEIPQEIGDFSVLIYSGFSKVKALVYNFLSALMAVLGALIILTLGVKVNNLSNFLIPLTAGGFLYIANSDLIPELHKEQGLKRSLLQLLFLLLGIFIMWLIK